jgi:hypothetical protein
MTFTLISRSLGTTPRGNTSGSRVGWCNLCQHQNPCKKKRSHKRNRVAFAGEYTPIFSAEHLAAELLRSGRLKDLTRVADLLKSEQMDMEVFRDIVRRHRLAEKWKEFASRYDFEE